MVVKLSSVIAAVITYSKRRGERKYAQGSGSEANRQLFFDMNVSRWAKHVEVENKTVD